MKPVIDSLRGWTGERYAFLGALTVRLALLPLFDFCLDDAYITFRIARNLTRGLGLVFNPGARILVTSTPLYTLLTTPGELLGIGAPLWSKLLNALAVAIACALVSRLLRGSVRNGLRLLVVLGMALSPFSIFMSLTGMESPIVFLLLLLATLFYREGLGIRLGFVLGACFLIRPEGALAAALFWMAVLLTRKRILWRVTLPLLLVAAAWLAYSISFFGSPIPHSVLAKRALFSTYPIAAHINLKTIFWHLWAGIPLFPVMLPLLPLGAWNAFRHHREFIPLTVWTLMVLFVQVFSGFSLVLWYIDMLTPQVFILLVLGVEQLLARGTPPAFTRSFRRVPVLAGVTLAAAAGTVFVSARIAGDLLDARTVDHHMARIGSWFVETGVPPERSVGVEAIGRIGYESDMYIIDTFGLATHETIVLIRGGAISDEELLHRLQPDYYISGRELRPQSTGGYFVVGEMVGPVLNRSLRRGFGGEAPCYIYSAPVEYASSTEPQ